MINGLTEQQVKPPTKWVVTETVSRLHANRHLVKPPMKWVVTETGGTDCGSADMVKPPMKWVVTETIHMTTTPGPR